MILFKPEWINAPGGRRHRIPDGEYRALCGEDDGAAGTGSEWARTTRGEECPACAVEAARLEREAHREARRVAELAGQGRLF